MREVKINLATVNDVKNFVNAVMQFDCNFDIVADRYAVDAKSIMGIFSLDLSKPLMLHIESDDEELSDIIMEKIKCFRVN